MSPPEERGTGRLRVRPYAITGGRTRSSTDIPLETIILTTDKGESLAERLTMERSKIVEMCRNPLSVAEISAYLHVPLGVARVLVGDMTEEGLVDFNRPRPAGDRPDLKLLERVLDGLQAL
ncbi:MAG: DUF742 domain-containing protein [Actinobacteria bacterium]|nr:DUF742 domain-containing protein [Actinomycetota bacterium]